MNVNVRLKGQSRHVVEDRNRREVMIRKMRNMAKRLNKDVEGGIPVAEILMVAAIVVPLLLGGVAFGDKVSAKFKDSGGKGISAEVKSATF